MTVGVAEVEAELAGCEACVDAALDGGVGDEEGGEAEDDAGCLKDRLGDFARWREEEAEEEQRDGDGSEDGECDVGWVVDDLFHFFLLYFLQK